jgi:hypothetical protein
MTTWVEEFHDFAGGAGGNHAGNTNQFGAMTTGGAMKRLHSSYLSPLHLLQYICSKKTIKKRNFRS